MNGSKNQKAEETITRIMRKVEGTKDWLVTSFRGRGTSSHSKTDVWPVLPGAYIVGNPRGHVAVCTLTSNELITPLAKLPGVAITGRVYSANMGIEKMIANVIANPAIRFLFICGRESPYFQVEQALCSLFSHGITPEGRIIQASGHMPELRNLDPNCIEHFRKQIELVDYAGETDIEKLAAVLQEMSSRNPGVYQEAFAENKAISPDSKTGGEFRPVRLGGHRESLAYDPKGFFIITLDRRASEILVHHYWQDHSPAHVVRGRNGEAILLALLREELISQKSHAGYLGAELAKAETALHFDLPYEQDRPLRLPQQSGIRSLR